MAGDSEQSNERSTALPRRVPGAGGLTPAQVRRGFLPPRAPESGATQAPPDRERPAAPRPGGPLPQRTPGTSAIQSPPQTSPRPPMTGREAQDAMPPSPATFAASAAKLLSTARPAARQEPAVRVTGGPSAPAAPRRAEPDPDVRPASNPRAGRTRHPGRRWRLAGVLISLVLVAVAVLTIELSRREHPAAGAPGVSTAGSRRIAAETFARGQAVAWVTSQVGHYINVACDAVVCSELAQHGIPAADLQVLRPTSPDPYGGVLIIATADIRSQFGGKLATVYAPQVIASFGTGTNRIDIRVVAQMGPAAFRAAFAADLAARRSSGAELLRNRHVTASPSARALLSAGQVDLRLLTTIAFLADQHPVDISGFATSAPGGSPGLPLRFAYLAVSDPAAHMASSTYVHALIALVSSQPPPYVPLNLGVVRLSDGQQVVRLEFPAPSPTGLLKP